MRGVSGKPGDALGKIVFSPRRIDGVPRDEENTEEEKKVFNIIYRYVFMNSYVSEQEGRLVFKYAEHPSYSDYFHAPTTEKVYRGLNIRPVNAGFLKKWLGNPVTIPEEGESEGTWTMGARDSSFTSYTTNIEKAKDFCYWNKKLPAILAKEEGTEFYSVIFVANTANNSGKFLDMAPLYDSLDEFGSNFGEEQEAIGFGKINVSKIMWKLRK